jgi:hypothetical protein
MSVYRAPPEFGDGPSQLYFLGAGGSSELPPPDAVELVSCIQVSGDLRCRAFVQGQDVTGEAAVYSLS